MAKRDKATNLVKGVGRGGRLSTSLPPVNNANYAWIHDVIHHSSLRGVVGVVMANDSMSSHTSNEGGIREALIEADLVDCIEIQKSLKVLWLNN